MPVDIAFITVNYNTLPWLMRLADFFRDLAVPFSFSFHVVDNGSRDGSQEFLRARREIHLLEVGENIGYGCAINRGVSATASTYVCVLNTDVILNREALVALWRFLEARPEVGICAPRITYEDGRDQGMVFRRSLFSHYVPGYAKVRARWVKREISGGTAPLRVDGVQGAFFLVRRSSIPPPSLFDEDFFFFHEDTALAHKLKDGGIPCFVLPTATIIHAGGQSRSAESVALFYSSKYLYLKKFYGPRHARAIYLLDRARILRKWFLYSLLSLGTTSELIRSKQRYYGRAWSTARWR